MQVACCPSNQLRDSGREYKKKLGQNVTSFQNFASLIGSLPGTRTLEACREKRFHTFSPGCLQGRNCMKTNSHTSLLW